MQIGAAKIFGGDKAITIAGKDHLATGDGCRTEIQNAITQPVEVVGRIDRVGEIPVAGPRVRGKFLVGQLLRLARLQVDAINISTGTGQIAALRFA